MLYGTPLAVSLAKMFFRETFLAEQLHPGLSNKIPTTRVAQGTKKLNKPIVNRLFLAVWLLCSMILTTAYSGLLIVDALMPKYSEPVGTVEGILGSGLPWNFARHDAIQEKKLNRTSNPVPREFWEKKNYMFSMIPSLLNR